MPGKAIFITLYAMFVLLSCSEGNDLQRADNNTPSPAPQSVQEMVEIPTDFIHTTQVIAEDLTNNGFVDIAVISKLSQMRIFYNRNGSIDFTDFKDVETLYPNVSLCSCDINEDGHVDIVPMTEAKVGPFFLGNSSGSFTNTNETLPYNGRARYIICTDVNNDNRVDLVASGYGTVNIYINEGNLAFSQTIFKVSNMFINKLPTAEDLDGDGDTDILLPDFGRRILYVSKNKENQGFEEPQEVFSGENSSMGAALTIRQNTDEVLPQVVYTVDGSNQLAFIKKEEDKNTYKPINKITVLPSPFFLNTAFMNNDREIDLVVNHHPGSIGNTQAGISVCYGPDFQCPDTFSIEDRPFFTAIADWDMDGFPDIFVPVQYDAKKVIFIHSPGKDN